METKPWQTPYPMENWKMRYMVVWIQNHDKFIVLIWKTLDMRLGYKIRINSLHSVTNNIGVNFTLIVEYELELYSLLKTLLWLWDAEQQ